MRLRDRLEIWEEHWSAIEPSKRILITLFLIAAIGYLAYMLFLSDMIDELERQKSGIISLKQKIEKNNPRFLERKIIKIKKEVLSLKADIEKLREKKVMLETRLAQEGYLFFNQKSFSLFLDKALQESVRKDIRIDSVEISNLNTPYLGLLKEVKEVKIDGKARFVPLVEYVRFLEDAKTLFKIEDFRIETNGSEPRFSLRLHFLGATL